MIKQKTSIYLLLGLLVLIAAGYYFYSTNVTPNSQQTSKTWETCVHPLFSLRYPSNWFVYNGWVGRSPTNCDRLTSEESPLFTSQEEEFGTSLQEDSLALITNIRTKDMREAPPPETGFNNFIGINSIEDMVNDQKGYFIRENSIVEQTSIDGEDVLMVFPMAWPEGFDQWAAVFHNDVLFEFYAQNISNADFKTVMETLHFSDTEQ